MSTLAPEHAQVLDALRERSDGTHEDEYVTSRDFPGKTLPEMALLGLVRLSGPSRVVHRAYVTDRGVAALSSHELASLMGRCYIKVDREQDLYVVWSSVVDSAVGFGTREEMIIENKEEYGRSGEISCLQALDRADEYGTSARDGGPGHLSTGAWDDEELLIMEGGGPGYLKRADLQAYCDLYPRDGGEPDWAEVAKLITPLPDDEDD